ncbi:hypothetical protein [Arthrobacter psychrolactophilus]
MTRPSCLPDWLAEVALDLSPVKGGAQHRLRLALKMAWRDIRRHRGRSALIMALIALPIFAMSFALTAGMSTQATAAETVAMELGQTQGRLGDLHAPNANTVQAVSGDTGRGGGAISMDGDPNFVATAPADAVPPGYTAIPWHSATLYTPVGKAQIELRTTVADVLNPAFKGKYTLLDGVAPTSATQALATRGLLERFGLKLGEELTTSAGTFSITGTIRPESQGDGETFLFLKKEQLPAEVAQALSPATVYLVGEKALKWADAKAFNAQGVMLTSRSLILDPPSKAELGPDAQFLNDDWRSSGMVQLILMGGLIGVLALLEVGLLAGAAFAVGARKQQRDLALLAASGAEGPMVRATVTASGLWLGLAGGAIGAVLGSIAAVITVLVVREQGLVIFKGLHLMWLPTIGLVLLGVVAGVVAAMVPARAVAKQATLSALKSGRTADAPSKWGTRIGIGLIGVAVICMVASSAATIALRGNENQWQWAPWLTGLAIAGAVALVFAFILMTGRLIELLTKRTAWLPVPLRLAARDSARNRGRTVPAVAAVLAAATLSGALMVGTASIMQNNSENYNWSANLNQGGIELEFMDYNYVDVGGGAMSSDSAQIKTVDAVQAAKQLEDELGPGITTQVLHGTPRATQCELDVHNEMVANGKEQATPQVCPEWGLSEPVDNRCKMGSDNLPEEIGDWRCVGSMARDTSAMNLPKIIVGGEAELTALLGRVPSAEARKVLADGGMVLSNKIFLQPENTVDVVSYDPHDYEGHNFDPVTGAPTFMRYIPKPLTSHSLAAVVDAPEKALAYYGVMSPEAAAAVQLPVSEQTLLVTVPQALTRAEQDQLQSAMAPLLGQYNYINIETVSVHQYGQDPLVHCHGRSTHHAQCGWHHRRSGARRRAQRSRHAGQRRGGHQTPQGHLRVPDVDDGVVGHGAGCDCRGHSHDRGALAKPWPRDCDPVAPTRNVGGVGAALRCGRSVVLTKGKLPLTRRQTLA